MRGRMRKLCLLSSLAIAASGCVTTVPNIRVCTVAGNLEGGMICSDNHGQTSEMTAQETVEFLEPAVEPPRAGAVCMTANDFGRMKTALEKACRRLGRKCSYEVRAALAQMGARL